MSKSLGIKYQGIKKIIIELCVPTYSQPEYIFL